MRVGGGHGRPTSRARATFAVALLLVVLSGAGAAAQDFDLEAVRASKRLVAVRMAEPIEVDGVLDEPAWRLAEPATDFLQQFPDEFAPATERSEIRFLYDADMLYVGGMLYDQEPHRLVINELRRDFDSFFSDSVAIIIDTFLDERTGYGFWVSPGGARRDVQAFDNGRRNDANWDGVWLSHAVVLEDGWSFELAIPFKTLRFPAADTQEWGLNLLRIINRKNEFALWSPVPREFSHYSVSFAGRLTGIEQVARGRDLRVTPFTTARFDNGTTAAPGWGGEGDGGVDVKWGLTSSMLLDASYRTDFSQVEVDTQQINLTRFSLFFPEKRQFFLESPARFQVGLAAVESQRRDLVPFFSRRIGLSEGQPIPVIGGLRLTGQAGRQGIGLLTMQTDESEAGPGANFTVARLTRQATNTTSVGAFYLGRETTGSGDFNRVGGLEVRFAPRRALEVEAFAMRSATTGAAGDWAGRTSMRVDTNAHRARLGLVHVGDAFRHDLGFVRRRGIATGFGGYDRILRPADPGALVREQSFGVSLDATVNDRYTRLLTRVGSATYGLSFRDGGVFSVSANSTHEQLDVPFTVGSDLLIAAGDYTFETVTADYRSNRSAAVSGSLGIEAGEFWNGTQRIANGSVRFRLSEHVAASATLARNSIELPQGSFAAGLAGLRLDWSFTPAMSLNAFVQYNGETDSWLSNTRFNLIHRPLSDIYIVWNEARSPTDTRRAVMLKYTHLVAF
jgi:hypothetical protein